jgi:lysophospholipase L1-like esterase
MVTVWNGAAPGRDATYSYSILGKLMPSHADLVVVSHGHNVKDPETIRNLVFSIAQASDGTAAMALTNENPRADVGAPAQAEKIKFLTGLVRELPGVPLIDSASAFPKDPTPFLGQDLVHPNAQGYRAWADVFLALLGL